MEKVHKKIYRDNIIYIIIIKTTTEMSKKINANDEKKIVNFKGNDIEYYKGKDGAYFNTEGIIKILGYEKIIDKEWLKKADKMKSIFHIMNNIDADDPRVKEGIEFMKNFNG